MKFFAAVVLLALGVNAKEIGKCQMSHWGQLSECHKSKLCDSEKPGVEYTSYSLPAAKYDAGRQHMNILIKIKQDHWRAQTECRAAGTCPELVVPSAMGYTPCVDGMAGRYPCRNIDIQSFLNFEEMGYVKPAPGDNDGARGNDIWGWTDPETNDEYAIMGFNGGTAFVRVTNPNEPEPLAFMYTRTTATTWRDMKVIDNTAYIVSEAADHGLQVFDLLKLRGAKKQNPVPIVEPDAVYSEFGNAHNIVANEETKFLYVVGATFGNYKTCSGGLHVIDVSDRLNPKFAGCFAEDGYVHDAQCINYHGPDQRYKGREICFCYNEDTFTLVDVHDKNNMTMIAKEGYLGYQYTHQGWLTEDHTIALLDDELDEANDPVKNTKTYLWDVTDLQKPVLKNTYFSSQEAIDHNQYVLGQYTYQANYRAGLRILYIDQENYDLNEVAYLDTYPDNTIAEFDGAWSNYPYFASGNIIVSSIDYGLFVVRPKYEAMEEQKKQVHSQRTRRRSVVSCAKNVVSPQLESFVPCAHPVC